jgi:hypothetical protein
MSTGQTAPTSFSASAPVIRAAVRDYPSNSLEDSLRRNPSLGAAVRTSRGGVVRRFDPRSFLERPVCLTEVCVEADLKARRTC